MSNSAAPRVLNAADVAFLTNHGGLTTVDMQVWVGLAP